MTRRVLVGALIVLSLMWSVLACAQGRGGAVVQAEPAEPTVAAMRPLYAPAVLRGGLPMTLTPTAASTAAPTTMPTITPTATPSDNPAEPPIIAIASSVAVLSQPALAYNTARNEYVVAWVSNPEGMATGWLQRLDAQGAPTGQAVRFFDGYVGCPQPDVAYNPVTDQYLVAWGHSTMYGVGGDIHRRLYSYDLRSQGGSTRIISGAGYWSQASVACNPADGSYYLAYIAADTLNGGALWGVLLNSAGQPTAFPADLAPRSGPEKAVDVAFHPGRREYMAVCEDHSVGAEQRQASYLTVSAAGELLTGLTPIDPGVGSPQSAPAAAAHSLGAKWLIAWDDNRTPGDNDVWGALAPNGDPHPLSDTHGGAQSRAALASDEAALYLAVWQDTRAYADGAPAPSHIYARCLDGDGLPIEDLWPVTAATHDSQGDPALAYNRRANEYLVVWQAALQDGTYAIQSARVNRCVTPPAHLVVGVSGAPSGPLCPGEQIALQFNISNDGERAATNVCLGVTPGAGWTVLPGGDAGRCIASLAPGDSVALNVTAQVAASLPLPAQAALGYALTADALPPFTGEIAAPLGAPELTATMDDGLAVGASACPGDPLTYTVIVTNTGSCTAHSVTFRAALDPNAPLPSGDVNLRHDFGDLPAGQSARYQFTARVADCPPSGIVEIANQGRVTCAELSSATLTDDPETAAAGDATRTGVNPHCCDWVCYDSEDCEGDAASPRSVWEDDDYTVVAVRFENEAAIELSSVRCYFTGTVEAVNLIVANSDRRIIYRTPITPDVQKWITHGFALGAMPALPSCFFVGVEWIQPYGQSQIGVGAAPNTISDAHSYYGYANASNYLILKEWPNHNSAIRACIK